MEKTEASSQAEVMRRALAVYEHFVDLEEGGALYLHKEGQVRMRVIVL